MDLALIVFEIVALVLVAVVGVPVLCMLISEGDAVSFCLGVIAISLFFINGVPMFVTSVQDFQISREPPATGIVKKVDVSNSLFDRTRITLGDAIYYLDCVGYTPAEGAEVSYRANGERIFEISPADAEE